MARRDFHHLNAAWVSMMHATTSATNGDDHKYTALQNAGEQEVLDSSTLTANRGKHKKSRRLRTMGSRIY
jgi:hypothetical protein